MEKDLNHLFTVGCSTHSSESFIDILKNNTINAFANVRSNPYSRHTPQFNTDQLKLLLENHTIHYLSFGEEFGARRSESETYSDGKVNFSKVMQIPVFLRGVNRIKDGLAKGYQIALMCTEKDPVDCHRFILVATFNPIDRATWNSIKKLCTGISIIWHTSIIEPSRNDSHYSFIQSIISFN